MNLMKNITNFKMVCTGGKNNNVGNIKVYAPYDHSDMSDWLSNPRRPQSI
jgi:hypothetical protein